MQEELNIQSTDVEKIFAEIESAEKKIRSYIRETPLEYSSYLSNVANKNVNVFLKLENLQHTGSFKVRGAFNKILTLSPEQQQRGIITASTGNHGMATGYVLQKLQSSGTVFLPENASKAKLSKLQEFDVDVSFYGQDSGETEKYARKIAHEKHQVYISPYNDIDIIAGQGTIGIELIRQLKEIDYVLITIGGGGLVSGIATYLKSINNNTKIIGCLPEHSPVFYESIKAGRILEIESKTTLSDGSAGGIEDNAITFDLIANNKLVDDYILVSEKEIEMSMQTIFREHRLVIEGAAAVAVSAFIKEKDKYTGNVVILICGANIDMDIFLSIVCQ